MKNSVDLLSSLFSTLLCMVYGAFVWNYYEAHRSMMQDSNWVTLGLLVAAGIVIFVAKIFAGRNPALAVIFAAAAGIFAAIVVMTQWEYNLWVLATFIIVGLLLLILDSGPPRSPMELYRHRPFQGRTRSGQTENRRDREGSSAIG